MNKRKRSLEIGYREKLLRAKGFDYTIFVKPRNFTHHLSSLVRYPKLINDIGRTVDVRRAGENRFAFELQQKRYLGRGTYVISALAKGSISYDEASQQTQVTGFVQPGGRYVILLMIMSLVSLLSLALSFVTILFLPLSLLMLAVMGLHWTYLFADRDDLQQQLAHLVNLTERAERLKDSEINQRSIDIENSQIKSALLK